MKIALYGFMGAGKSSLGKLLASRLGYAFFDLDKEIESFSGRTINEIFLQDGEIAFRRLEHRVLKQLVKNDLENSVVSLGGGTILQPQNRKLLELKSFYKIFLDVTVSQLYKRLKKEKSQRPLLKDISEEDLPGFIEALHDSRWKIYNRYSDLKLQIDKEDFNVVLDRLTMLLRSN